MANLSSPSGHVGGGVWGRHHSPFPKESGREWKGNSESDLQSDPEPLEGLQEESKFSRTFFLLGPDVMIPGLV